MGTTERLALAMHTGNMAWSDTTRRPVEFVAAMSAASGLGSDIFRSKGYDYAAARRAVMVLANRSQKRSIKAKIPISAAVAQLMALAVLVELGFPHCRMCGGARVIVAGELKVECPTCGGHGTHRYPDDERARLCGLDPREWDKWASRYELVRQIALAHDVAPAQAGARLG